MNETHRRESSIVYSHLKMTKLLMLFLLLIGAGAPQLQASGQNSSNGITINRNDSPLINVMKEIEEKSNYVFFVNNSEIDTTEKVSLHVSEASLNETVNALLKGTRYTYQIHGKQILITVANKESVKSSPRKITGKVVDESGEPLIGVNIQIKGISQGTITGIDGTFTLMANVSDESILVVSYIGMKSVEIPIKGKSAFNVKLVSDAELLNEVVVTAMGIKRLSKTLSYTAESVSGNELTRVKDANLINSLQGKSAGLVITPNSNGAGGSSKILLRGNKSIQGNNNPLIVIDGMPMANNTNDGGSVVYGGGVDQGDALSTVNPDDIANISILKGASAAALYGAVAANGVIMITTKKGGEGNIKVDFSSNMTTDAVWNLPELQNTYGTTINDRNGKPTSPYSWGEKMDVPAFDQIQDYYDMGYNLNNSIALSGGSKKSQSYFSYGNTVAKGITPTNKFVRHNISAHQTFQALNDRLTMDFTVNYTYSETKNKPSGGMLDNPLVGLYIIPRNVDYQYYRDNYELVDPARPTVPTQNWLVDNWKLLEEHNQNPYWMLHRGVGTGKRHRFSTSGTVKFQLLDCLNVQGRLSFERDNTLFKREKYATTYRMSMGAYNHTTSFYEHLFGDVMASFNKKIGDFTLSATAGSSFTLEKSPGTYINGEGDQYYEIDVTDDKGTSYRLPQGNVYFPNIFNRGNYYDIYVRENFSQKRLNAVFATAQVGYKEMAYVDVTARNDWSSALAYTENMSFFYPSVGATVLVNEIFGMNEELFSLIKLRASYSIVGNDIPAYYSHPVATVNGLTISLPTLMPFRDWKPEKTYSIEAGFDLAFFQNRLQTEFTFYKANTKNQYFQVDAPVASGYSKRNINAGNVENLGVEASIRYNFNFANDWTWTPAFNFSYNKNEIKELCPGVDEYNLASSDAFILKLKKGGSYGDVYTRDFQYDDKGNIKLSGDGTPLLTGKVDSYAGNFNSKVHLGWANTISWKNLHIYALVDGKVGGKVLSMTEAILDGYGVSKRSGEARDQGGVANTDGTLIDAESYYSAVGGRTQSAGFAAKQYMYSATNFRLREFSIGYTFIDLFGENKKLTASLVGRNLFFIYKKAPCDPDISGSTKNGWQGIDVFSLPTTRSFGLNLKLNF